MLDDKATPDAGGNAARDPAPDAGPAANATPDRDPRADIPARLASEALLADVEDAGLSDEELAVYQRRVAEGFYNSREVAAEVARRMLRSRDI